MNWEFPTDMSIKEQQLCQKLGVRSRFYCFLRRVRHLVFDAGFQRQLASMYEQRPSGKPPVAPALLAMTVLLQAYTGASDAEAIECIKADQRWQLPLGCLGRDVPFCQKTLAFFRGRLVEAGMDEQLLARTVQLARESKLFDPKKLGKLRVAIDSAPLQGAGRVEDTINLIGHAIRNLVNAIADEGVFTQTQIARALKLTIIGAGSVKARLDIDWNDKKAQRQALRSLVQQAERLQRWIQDRIPELQDDEDIAVAMQTLRRVIDQDIEPDPDGSGPRIKDGVAPDRQISLSDPDMRHGRKSSARRIDGYKRYQASDLGSGLTIAGCALPANVPEHEGADKMRGEIEQHGKVTELQIDRAFLPSKLTLDVHDSRAKVVAKPYSHTNGDLFTKQQFDIDLQAGEVRCPAGNQAHIQGDTAKFPRETCVDCALRTQCQKPTSHAGRIITIHPQELLMQELQRQISTATGRKKLRQRVQIEHSLAHHCNRQGPRARYRGTRKNDFDVRRIAAVNNLMVIAAKSHDGEALERMAA
jgi:hypothetical protein